MADDIATIRRVGLQRAYALIRDLEAYRAFSRLTPGGTQVVGRARRGEGTSVL
jgi:hypothetical protein